MKILTSEREWDVFFSKATDDISDFRWTLDQWNRDECDHFDLFLEMTYMRWRSLEARAILMNGCPDNYSVYKDKFIDLIKDAEAVFGKIIRNEPAVIDAFQKAFEQLRYVEGILGDMQSAYNGKIIFEDSDLIEDLHDLGSRFLEMFLGHKYINDQADGFVSVSTDAIAEYHQLFVEIDKKFRAKFYLFKSLETIIQRYREDSYAPEHYWWLSRDIPEKAANDVLIPSFIDWGFDRLRRTNVEESCPSPEQIAAYAFGELRGNKREALEAHFLKCSTCLEEVISLRHVEASTPIPTYEETGKMDNIEIPEKIIKRVLKLRESNVKDLLYWIKERANKTRREIAENMSAALDSFFPDGVRIAFVGLKGTPEEIKIPKPVLFAVRQKKERLTLIDLPEREQSDDIRELSKNLWKLSFYYSLYGMGPGSKPKVLTSQVCFTKSRGLPIEVDIDSIKGADIVWLLAHSTKKDMEDIHTSLQNSLDNDDFIIPPIKPIVWLIVYAQSEDSQN